MQFSDKLVKLGFLATLFCLSSCAKLPADPTIIYQNQTPQQITAKGDQEFRTRHYDKAIQAYEALDALFPFTPYSEQARLNLIYSYYMHDDIPSMQASIDQFIRLYPVSSHIDYAFYMKGIADFNQDRGWYLRYTNINISMRDPGTMFQSFQDFKDLVQRMPMSLYVPDARQRMVYLRNLFANHELYIANYYYQKKAYVAASNRALDIVQNYQGAYPAVRDALIIMFNSYQALGINGLAEQTQHILEVNYPNYLKNISQK